MSQNLTQKLIGDHVQSGSIAAGEPVSLRFDQTLCQDATGTLVMLTLEAMELDRVRTDVSVQYVDHNLLQEDHKNPDDHLFLLSAAQRFGLWYSRAGNGISHPLHMQRFGVPGATLIGSDSHTCAAGCMGMFAVGAGGADVAMAMAGEPITLPMPAVWGIELQGQLPDWVSAKDVILELLRRHNVDGGLGRAIEYYGPGVKHLSAMDRHVIANMGAELGATASVFPSDAETQRFMRSEGREHEWHEFSADPGCAYDYRDCIDLSTLEPLIARPSSPGNVVPVRDVEGEPIYQSYIGSSANPGYRDFAVAAEIVRGRVVPEQVSLDINPTSRQLLHTLIRDGRLDALIGAGARLHQCGCNGCIGMGQAPATGKNSLRTTPRNFPGRSGTREDSVWLCSPETAAASALTGAITDPRSLPVRFGIDSPTIGEPERLEADTQLFVPPVLNNRDISLQKGPNILSLPDLDALPDRLRLPVLLKLGDNISTDEILPGGAEVLPYRSNIPKIADFAFDGVDRSYPQRAQRTPGDGHAVIGGRNYGQGSSREHAALAPRYLGLRVVIARGFARIHRQNLINFGVLPLTFIDSADYQNLEQDDVLILEDLQRQIGAGGRLHVAVEGKDRTLQLEHDLSSRQQAMMLAGGLVAWLKRRA